MTARLAAAWRSKTIMLSLRSKTLLLVSGTLLSLLALFYALSRSILLDSFRELEAADTREHVLRVQSALADEIARLDAVAGDWAPWTDTYDFVRGEYAAYVEDNMMDSTFINLQINLMLFMNSSAQIVYAKNFDLQNEVEVPVPAALREQLSPDHPLLQHDDPDSSFTGLLLLPEAPLMVAAQPIVTSSREGPTAGTLVVGLYLDAAQTARLSDRTRLSFSVERLDQASLPADSQRVLAGLSDEMPIFIQPADSQTVSGYFRMKDTAGAPALLVKVDRPRGIYQRGEDTLKYLIFVVTITGLVFSGATLFLLERFVLNRLTRVTGSVWSIGQSSDHSARVPVPDGDDEVRQLATTINDMLESLQKSETQLQQSAILLKEIHHRVKNNLQVIASLLALQSNRLSDEDAAEFLKESQNRIQSIALIHEKLYSSTQPNLVDLSEYTRSLAAKLRYSLDISGAVSVDVRADPIILEVDRAVPIGLILNELITNAFRHAFPGGRAGEIGVELRKIEDKECWITVRDNGVGFPEGFDINQSATLGMQLVVGLTGQLDGTVALRQDGGAAVEIRFCPT